MNGIRTGQQFRIGQVVPSSNTTMETEIPAMLRARESIRPHESFTFHSSRARMENVTLEELQSMNRDMHRCVAELADARVDVLSTACLIAIMAMGRGHHRVVESELADTAMANGCNSPVLTSAGALLDGLQILGAKRIALIAPYMRALTNTVIEYIQDEGIAVVSALSFEISDNREVGSRDPMLLIQDVKRLDTSGADAVVLSACVQMQSLPAVQAVEDALGLPVVSTAICTVRRMLDSLKLEPIAPNAGALLVGESR